MSDEWPLRTSMKLGALPSAEPQVLWEWEQSERSEAAEFVVSELVTNGVAASRSMRSGSPVWLWMLSDKSRVRILVGDAAPGQPEHVDADADAESGRGLLLVTAFSNRWGWYPVHDRRIAKVVWADLGDPLPSAESVSQRCHMEGCLQTLTSNGEPLNEGMI